MIHESSCKMLKTWSADILKSWKKVFYKTYKVLYFEDQTKVNNSFNLVMGLNDK